MKVLLILAAAAASLFAVDRFFRGRTGRLKESGLHPPEGQGTDADVERLLTLGYKIEAIKLHREIHGGDLKSAKEAVESLAARLRSEGRLKE